VNSPAEKGRNKLSPRKSAKKQIRNKEA